MEAGLTLDGRVWGEGEFQKDKVARKETPTDSEIKRRRTQERLFDFVRPRGRRPCHVGRNVTIKWRPTPLTSPAVNRLVLIASC